MNIAALTTYLRWLCEELVHALLRPVWNRYLVASGRSDGSEDNRSAASESAYLRFLRLVDAADCWPCRIEWSRGSPLWITSDPVEEYDDYDAFDRAFEEACA